MLPYLRCIAVVASALAASGAAAQYQESQPIKLIVAQAAGSGTDTAARVLAEELGQAVGRAIVVENKPGALGTIGAAMVAKAKPDGHTLLMIGGTAITGAPYLMADMPFDPQKDLMPIYRLAGSPMVLYVSAKQNITSAQSFLEKVRAKPGAYSYAASHAMNMVAMEAFKKDMGLQMPYIPYKGGPQALTDIAGGEVAAMFNDISGSASMAATGRIRGLAIMRKERLPDLPDLPTVYEVGYKGPLILLWTGLFAPAGTPDKLVAYLNREISKITAKPEFNARMKSLGLDLNPTDTPQAFAKFIREESEVLGPYIKASRMQK